MNKTQALPIFLLCLLISFTALSCLKDDDSNVKINIDKEFDITFYETLVPGDNKLVVHVSTKENLDCSNYNLRHSSSLAGDKLIVSIDDLELEGDCDNIPTVSHTTALFGTVENGNYEMELNLSLNSITNEGSMSVNDEEYNFEMETSHGITLTEDHLYTIPDDYFWGYVELSDNTATDIRDAFLNALNLYSNAADINDGYYGHFTYENGKARLNPLTFDEGIPSDPNTFIYKLEGDKQALLDFVQAFQTDQEDILKVVLLTGDGEVL